MKYELNWIETSVVMAGALAFAWLLGMEISGKLFAVVACAGFLAELMFQLKLRRS